MQSAVTREDVVREVTFLRALLEKYPALQFLVDGFDPDELQLSGVPQERGRLAAKSKPAESRLEALANRQNAFKTATSVINRRYMDGDLSLQEWHDLMRRHIKDMHITAYMVGMDGRWSDMSPSDWGRVGQTIQQQYGYLANWAIELAGDRPLSLAQMNQRAGFYAAAATQSFSKGRSTRAGFNPNQLPAHPGDGTTECRANCRCYWRIVAVSKRRRDYNCTWTLGNAEHCRTCRSRARSWRSLKIRGGVMQRGVEQIGG